MIHYTFTQRMIRAILLGISLGTVLLVTAYGAFTEFYCESGGSNVNGGSNTGAAIYSATNGGWNSGTGVYTPTTGTNPVSAGVAVGQFASVYVDGATVAVFVGRVTNVTNATNGTITVSTTIQFGTAPTTNASARSIVVGGAWNGPNAADTFPFNVSGQILNAAVNSSSDQVCVNIKNDQTYTMTSQMVFGTQNGCRVQGYTSSVRDGGRATFTSNVTASVNYSISTGTTTFVDLIFASTAASGSANVVNSGSTPGNVFIRCVVHGGRGSGFTQTSGLVTYHECEAYDNNKSNSASLGGFVTGSTAGSYYSYCYSHDNTGSNTAGFLATGTQTAVVYKNCIADTNGGIGISATGSGSIIVDQCDLYNNTSDGIKSAMSQSSSVLIVQNSNFIKNGGKGINVTTTGASGNVANNGYGSGTQANGSADSLKSMFDYGTSITYASGVTPYNAPTTGDFSNVLAASQGVGRGAFTETDGTNTGTVGFPDVSAAQAQIGVSFPTPTPTPTVTPTATPTATPTSTPTPIETSYSYPG